MTAPVSGKGKTSGWPERLRAILFTVSEYVFLAALCAWVFYYTCLTTTLWLRYPAHYDRILLIVLAVTAAIRIPVLWLQREKRRQILAAAAMALIYWLVWHKNGYTVMLFLALLTLGTIGLPARRVIGCYLVTVGTVIAVTILAAMGGGVINYVTAAFERIRSAWGINYPTVFSAFLFYLALALWVFLYKVPDWLLIPVPAAVILVSVWVTGGINTRICSLVFLFVLICASLGQVLREKYGDCAPAAFIVKWSEKIANGIMLAAFPVLALFMCVMTYAFMKNVSVAVILDQALHSRFLYPAKAIREYGIHAFGASFSLVGGNSTDPDYNFIDSAYLQIPIRYGVVLMVALCILWVWMTYRAIRTGNRRMAAALALVALNSVEEQNCIEVSMNILILLPFAEFVTPPRPMLLSDRVRGIRSSMERGERGQTALVLKYSWTALCAFVLFLLLPFLMSVERTVIKLFHSYSNVERRTVLLVLLAAVLWFAVLWIAKTGELIRVLHERKRKPTWNECSLVLLLTALFVMGGLGVQMGIDAKTKTFRYVAAGEWTSVDDCLEAEAEILEALVDVAPGRVYVSDLPLMYEKRFPGIGRSFLYNEDLARYANTTVVTDPYHDCQGFIGSGFLFAEISPWHAVFTNDRAVIGELEKRGLRLTGYYSARRNEDLSEQASINGLERSPEGWICLDGPEHSMRKGPYLELPYGKHTAIWTLHRERVEGEPDDAQVATLRVTIYWGKTMLREIPVYAHMFDESGTAVVSAAFDGMECLGAEFPVVATEGCQLQVERVTVQMTPDQDVHAIYDENRHKVREEYYDPEGKPTLSSGGYASVDYTYDSAGNVIRVVYYDTEGAPALCNAGYARVDRVFDRKKQKTREFYYGTDGEPILLTGGYAAVEWEYDRAGNAAKTLYLDADGEPVVTSSGYAQVNRLYDDEKRVTEEHYFGPDGEGMSLANGQFGEKRAYDDKDRVTKITYLDIDGEPMIIKPGYAVIDREYNDAGQVIRESYGDGQGALIAIPGGYASTQREFDGGGRTSMMRYFDAQGELYEVSGGYVTWHRVYDDAGNVISERYYDAAGALTANTSGFAEIRRVFDDKKRCVEERYYGSDGKPVTCTGGYYGITRVFDEEGHTLVQTFIDVIGRPMTGTARYAYWEREYDEQGDPVEERYYDRLGKPVANSSGITILRRIYDEEHLCFREAYFDGDRKLVNNTSGFAILRRIYNGDKRVIREERYAKDGKPAAPGGTFAVDSDYNERGQLITQSYTDPQEEGILNSSGIAGIRYAYDVAENRYEDAYFDLAGEPVAATNGIAVIRRAYEKRRVVKERYYGTDAEAVVCTGGYAGVDRQYDEDGNQVIITHTDPKGAPVKNTSGVAIIRREYDNARNCIEESYYDEKGLPCENTSGVSVIRRLFNADRKTSREEKFDGKGNKLP